MLRTIALLFALLASPAMAADNMFATPGNSQAQGMVNMYLNALSQGVPVSATAPLPLGIYYNGSQAQISLDGALSVNTPASPQFADTFSAALDTTTNWTAKNSTGTAATSSGQLVVNSSTTASAWGGVSSQQSFAPVGVSPQTFGVLASFTVLAQANSTRVFGVFTVPGTPTTAVPVTDGYIYRLDGTGALFAEIWSSGVAVSSTNVTASCLPAANFPGIFAIVYRASLVQFTCGSALVVNQAPVLGINPANQVLPVSALSIAGSTPPGASAVMNLSAIALATISPGAVKSPNQTPTVNDPTTVVAISPNSAGIAIAPSSAASASNTITNATSVALEVARTAKASAGNLYGYYCTSVAGAAAGFCIGYNATACPANGAAVTAALVLDVCAFDTTNKGCSISRIPGPARNYSTGISVCMTSSTSPFATMVSNVDTGFISVDYQ